MTDKLAEEILDKIELKDICIGEFYYRDEVIEAMQAYHEAKMRKEKIVESFERENQYVTDEDIQAWAGEGIDLELIPDGWAEWSPREVSEEKIKSKIIGATAMRDGKTRHVSRDNDC